MTKHTVRLQRYLASCGVASRRGAEQLITEGRVSVNGVVVTQLGSSVQPGVDTVLLDERPVAPQLSSMYLFHKPPGMVTTMDDPQGRSCVGDVVGLLPERVFPIGRLDADVSGLLLFTNDGDYAQRLSHPRFEVERVYLAVVEGKANRESEKRLTGGIELDDGFGKAVRATVSRVTAEEQEFFSGIPTDCSLLELAVCEGRKHFVKRLLYAAGHPVRKLARIAFGPYELGRLAQGELRQIEFKKLSE